MTEYRISHGAYTALITPRGAAVRELRHLGRDLIVPFPPGGPIPDYRGVIAAPWPNRIRDGKYTFDGADHQLPVNEPERNCALHGFAPGLDWDLLTRDASSVRLACELGQVPGYPFALRLTANYRIDPHGLHATLTAENVGKNTAPYGACPHPYLMAGPAPLDEWILHFSAETFLEVTPDRLLPVAPRPVAEHAFNFRAPRAIGTTKIDHAFTGLNFNRDGRAELIVRDPGGTGVGIAWDRNFRWLQVHTADKEPPLPSRLGLAVEPSTCPPDALNSRQDLVTLEPGATHTASWSIYARNNTRTEPAPA